MYGRLFPGTEVSIRINPGFGSGLVKKLTSGGNHSSFGIWHEYVDQALEIIGRHRLNPIRLHFHIGSGHETTVLEKTVTLGLALSEHIPSIEILDLGGGYRLAAFADETPYDHHAMDARISEQLEGFYSRTGRRLKLELEPGTYQMALASSLVTRVIDITDTGSDGFRFIKIDGGLTELMRPPYYGARHPLVVAANGTLRSETVPYIVCGHCCIAGDNLTPVAGNSEDFTPQPLAHAEIGDFPESRFMARVRTLVLCSQSLSTDRAIIVAVACMAAVAQHRQTQIQPRYQAGISTEPRGACSQHRLYDPERIDVGCIGMVDSNPAGCGRRAFHDWNARAFWSQYANRPECVD